MASIVLVEDTPANRALATKLLAAAGHDVASASSGAEGVELVAERRPDLVLMDLGLPDIDGVDAMHQIRSSIPGGKELTIIAFTAHAMVGDRERALADGFDDYLSKPIEFETFVQSVEALLP
ncbi:MAG TPA: response regulator [Candidatus Limnocylindria bacterium]|nr:response regulator [Candidatus Limnocylindria bacterium]